ncbi:glycosyltransferase family 4 protein [Moorella sp. E306M]|uniref:glycosyltransferase family 4 protein n=1 Tax=Moorella sp. E306M TaxID=2572683 RepID=UPI0010FFB24D|nr:glycosyltransferase family 4 protein [Moorella sp. E306M]GEA17231.1 glycosyl transferase [Moorella sp. E306M]
MRILMLSTLCFPRTMGGVENHIYYLSKELIELGHYVEIFVPILEEAYPAKSVSQKTYFGLTVHEVTLNNPVLTVINRLRSSLAGGSQLGLLFAFLQKSSYQIASRYVAHVLLDVMRTRRMDLLHQHDFSANLFSTKIVSRYYPVMLTNHTGEFLHIKRRWYARPFLKFALNHYSRIIGPSPELAEIPYFPHKSVFIPNGVDTEFFQPLSEETRRKKRLDLGYNPEDFLILCPRRWAPTKGVIYLVQAIPLVVEQMPNTMFLFAGSDYPGYPDYRKQIIGSLDKIKAGGITNFRLLGNLGAEDLRLFYQISDVVVIPSILEAISLAALEAMACDCPVIATRVGGMPEIIQNGRTGLLVEAGNPEALAQAILKVGSFDKDRQREMGRTARQLVLDRYQWRKVAEATVKVYEEAIKGKKR